MNRARCFEWHARFKRGRTSLEDDERSGRPSTSSTPKNVETIRRLVHEDRRTTIKNIAAIVNVHNLVQCFFQTIHCIQFPVIVSDSSELARGVFVPTVCWTRDKPGDIEAEH